MPHGWGQIFIPILFLWLVVKQSKNHSVRLKCLYGNFKREMIEWLNLKLLYLLTLQSFQVGRIN